MHVFYDHLFRKKRPKRRRTGIEGGIGQGNRDRRRPEGGTGGHDCWCDLKCLIGAEKHIGTYTSDFAILGVSQRSLSKELLLTHLGDVILYGSACRPFKCVSSCVFLFLTALCLKTSLLVCLFFHCVCGLSTYLQSCEAPGSSPTALTPGWNWHWVWEEDQGGCQSFSALLAVDYHRRVGKSFNKRTSRLAVGK